ncbi:uncharacterized protein [Musca autumnalis]|uniref:uncharacterized protein n=1 Tax=Musca autumnalis TaxID=221902 RepID=UPI003CFA0BAF
MIDFHGFENPGYNLPPPTSSEVSSSHHVHSTKKVTTQNVDAEPPTETTTTAKRDNWGNDIEFLMSCIALSVGLGNVWRFPFIALENGGGAFLIPYIITLLLVGRPIYYLEMILGQFSSRGSVKVFEYAPIMKGIGYGQAILTFFIATYYSSLMSLTLSYLVDSFYATLPWSYCREEWGDQCIDSKIQKDVTGKNVTNVSGIKKTSAEFYFVNIVLHEKANIDDGIGTPSWRLAITLAVSWLVIGGVIIKGIKSSGKASYFLAIFPYVIMLVLLVRSLTLPGAFDGVLFFLTPQWDKLLDAKVWYAAVTQVFFSLTVCYGIILMYASFNRFHHNIYRDCNIVTTLDTFTSLLSGIVIFGILGNLAHESNNPDIKSVVKSGPGLAFISYPDAIAKFEVVPQIFSALFFLMMFILGVGSNVGVISSVVTVICDGFTSTKRWIVVIVMVVICYCFGLMYITPGGQFIMNYIDFYAVTLVAIVLGIFELIAASWIYGPSTLTYFPDVRRATYVKVPPTKSQRSGMVWRVTIPQVPIYHRFGFILLPYHCVGDQCIDSKIQKDVTGKNVTNVSGIKKTSAEFYFVNIVLHEKANIDDGIGTPSWRLAITLAVSWLVIGGVIIKGIKSSGKASYFLAIFPYVIMLVLLVRSLTLPGAFDGVLFFLTPQWDKLLDAKVWYAAVTQVFFSLTVCYGIILMYASFNRFHHNIYRDCNIVTTLDTFTSLLSGIVIFGILGNLAHESNNPDIKSVVKSGPGLAFISYPDAIAKFEVVPQIFSALFFLMMFILGVGSNVGVISSVVTVICDGFTSTKRWIVVIVMVVICYCFGLMYITPGGQFIMNYIDFYAVTLVAIVLGIFELIAASWIYGVKNICRDIKFMLKIKTSIYYRICWGIVTPVFMTAVLIYMLAEYEPLKYNDVLYPEGLYALGWCISAVGIGQLFLWGFYTAYTGPQYTCRQRFKAAFQPTSQWGPLDPTNLKEYKEYINDGEESASRATRKGFWYKFYDNIFG